MQLRLSGWSTSLEKGNAATEQCSQRAMKEVCTMWRLLWRLKVWPVFAAMERLKAHPGSPGSPGQLDRPLAHSHRRAAEGQSGHLEKLLERENLVHGA